MHAALLLSLALSLPTTLPPGDFPITVSRTGLAPNHREHIRMVTNGRSHLAVWIDERTGGRRLWATRVDAAGNALDGTGIPLGTQDDIFNFASASDGENYAVLWASSEETELALIHGETGAVQRVTLEDVDGVPMALSWSGNSYSLLYQFYGDFSRLYEASFDRDGLVLDLDVEILRTTGSIEDGELISVGNARLVRWIEDERMYVARVGGTVRTEVSSSDVPDMGSVATSGDRLFIVYPTGDGGSGGAALRARIFDANGTPAGAEIDAGSGQPYDNQLAAAWNGQHFLLFTVGSDSHSILLTRFTPLGVRVDATPVQADGETYNVAAAAAGGQTLFVYSHRPTGTGAALQWRSRRVGEANVAKTISLSAPNTGLPSIVWRGDHYLSVWLDRFGESNDAVLARFAPNGELLDAQPSVFAHPTAGNERLSVATDGHDALAVWHVHGGFSPDSIKGTLIRHDGTTIGIDIATSEMQTDLSVQWNGSEYLVAWGAQNVTVYAMRIAADGTLIDPQPRAIASERPTSRPALAWNGSEWIVAYTAAIPIDPNASYLQFNLYVHAVRLTRSLTPIGSPMRLSDREPSQPHIAVRGGETLVVWGSTLEDDRVYGSRIVNGSRVDAPGGFLIGTGTPTSVHADGDGYLVLEQGGYGWRVRGDQAGLRQKAFAFVPDVATLDLITAGIRPLVVYRREPDQTESMAQVRAHFVPAPERRRSVRN